MSISLEHESGHDAWLVPDTTEQSFFAAITEARADGRLEDFIQARVGDLLQDVKPITIPENKYRLTYDKLIHPESVWTNGTLSRYRRLGDLVPYGIMFADNLIGIATDLPDLNQLATIALAAQITSIGYLQEREVGRLRRGIKYQGKDPLDRVLDTEIVSLAHNAFVIAGQPSALLMGTVSTDGKNTNRHPFQVVHNDDLNNVYLYDASRPSVIRGANILHPIPTMVKLVDLGIFKGKDVLTQRTFEDEDGVKGVQELSYNFRPPSAPVTFEDFDASSVRDRWRSALTSTIAHADANIDMHLERFIGRS